MLQANFPMRLLKLIELVRTWIDKVSLVDESNLLFQLQNWSGEYTASSMQMQSCPIYIFDVHIETNAK